MKLAMLCCCCLLLTANARRLWLDGDLIEDVGVPMFETSVVVSVNATKSVLGEPLHGCWVDDATRIQGRIVWLLDVDPETWVRRCSLQQRVLAQRGAAAVLIGLTRENETQSELLIDGWNAAAAAAPLPPDAALVGMTTWRRGANASEARLEAANALDEEARSAQRARYLGYAVALALGFAVALAGALFEFLRRPARLSTLTWREMLRQDVGLYVLALTALAAFWKLLSVTLALEWLTAALSWPAFVWLSELGDVFLYEMLALYLYSWARMLTHSTTAADANWRRHNVLGVPTLVFMLLYGLGSLATLVHLSAVAESGRWSRIALLLTAMLYLCACYCYVGTRLWAVLRERSLVVASASAAASSSISWLVLFFCLLLVAALLCNGLLLALALGGLTSLATRLLANVADLVLLLNATLFFLYSDYSQARMGSAVKAMTASSSSSRPTSSSPPDSVVVLNSRDLTMDGDEA